MKIYSDNIAQKSDMDASAKENAKQIEQINHHIADLNGVIENQDNAIADLKDNVGKMRKHMIITGIISFFTGSGGGYALSQFFGL